jgi:hypothetical protein
MRHISQRGTMIALLIRISDIVHRSVLTCCVCSVGARSSYCAPLVRDGALSVVGRSTANPLLFVMPMTTAIC